MSFFYPFTNGLARVGFSAGRPAVYASDQDFVEPAFQFAPACSYTARWLGRLLGQVIGRAEKRRASSPRRSPTAGARRAHPTRRVGHLQGHDARLEYVGENTQDAGILRRASCDQDWIHVLANPARVQAQAERLGFHHSAGRRKWVVAVDKGGGSEPANHRRRQARVISARSRQQQIAALPGRVRVRIASAKAFQSSQSGARSPRARASRWRSSQRHEAARGMPNTWP